MTSRTQNRPTAGIVGLNAPNRLQGLSRRALAAAFLASALTAAVNGPAKASTTPRQEAYVTDVAHDVMKLANGSARGTALQSKFVTLLEKHADIASVAKFSLGKYRKKLKAGQQAEYFDLVENYVAKLLVYYVDDFAAKNLKINSLQAKGKWLIVDSRLAYADGNSSPLKWRILTNGKQNKVVDLNFRGIWLSLRMKDKFTSVLKQHDGEFAALLAFLRDPGW